MDDLNVQGLKIIAKVGKYNRKVLCAIANPERKKIPIIINTAVGKEDEVEVIFIFSDADVDRIGSMTMEDWNEALKG